MKMSTETFAKLALNGGGALVDQQAPPHLSLAPTNPPPRHHKRLRNQRALICSSFLNSVPLLLNAGSPPQDFVAAYPGDTSMGHALFERMDSGSSGDVPLALPLPSPSFLPPQCWHPTPL